MPTGNNVNLMLLAALLQAQKAAGNTPTNLPVHGPGGLLSMPGMGPTIVNAMVGFQGGLAARLPTLVSVETNPIFGILTGQSENRGTHSNVACGPNKKPGHLKLCAQTWPFGRFPFDSDVLQVDKLGQITNRGEWLDHTLIGEPFGEIAKPGRRATIAEAFRDEKANAIITMHNGFHEEFSKVFYNGNPATTVNSEGYIEPYGLDLILNDGYQDTYTGEPCPAADPLVVDLGGIDVSDNAKTVVTEITEFMASRKKLAHDLKLGQIKWVLVMRYSLFRMLTEIWPCTYFSYRCAPQEGSVNNIDSKVQTDMRNEMYKGHYLWIDGEQVEVVLDTAIEEDIVTPGIGQSDIYVVPLTGSRFRGNQNRLGALTYRECFNMSNARGVGRLQPFALAGQYQVTSGGRYLVFPLAPEGVCVQYSMLEKPRFICFTPFLGGRIIGLQYTWRHHERSPYRGDEGYASGGTSTYAARTYRPPHA